MFAGSCRRISAMVLRYVYILRGSWARIIELMYWPTIQMVLWGFISTYFAGLSDDLTSSLVAAIIGGVLLWDLLFRSQLGVSLSFMEEMWSRNLGHLFVSPLRPAEWCLSMMTVSLLRALIGMTPAVLLAIPFYGFSLFDFGLPLILFFFNLVLMGWWLGLVITAMLLRAGLGAEGLAWATTFLISPVSCVFYPVAVLPGWLQYVAWALPTSHVFEGMRALVFDGQADMGHIAAAFGLNCFYMCMGALALYWSFSHARKVGALLQSGE